MAAQGEATAKRADRTRRRREQILDAAQLCFRDEGFHGASMSRIATAAQMSVGHIYRYFESKDAIIIALCERNFEGFELRIPRAANHVEAGPAAIIDAWVAQFRWWIDSIRAPLTLEIMSEAGRNARVAQVVSRLDEHFRGIMRNSLLPIFGPIPPEEVEDLLEALTMLAHGMTSRITADADADPERIIAAFRLAFRRLFALPSEA